MTITDPIRMLILAGATFAATTCASAADQPSVLPAGVEVLQADFGLHNVGASGRPTFVPAKVVPYVPGQAYGWIIALRNEKSTIRWREEFTLPQRPATWGTAQPKGKRTLSADGRVAVTEREVSPPRGLISNTWAVAAGDPKGRYVIRVFVEGALVKVFEFDVQ